MSKPLLILGARKFALEVADVVSEIPGVTLVGFVENTDPARCLEKLEGLPVYWVDDLAGFAATHCAVCAFGSTTRRGFVEQAEAAGIPFATLIHPAARVSTKSRIGEGSVVWPGVVVSAYTVIGRHVLINRGALIGHHTELEDGITVGPGANIAGACHIGAGSYIGIGAVVVDYVRVGQGAVVAAGAVVTREVASHVMVAGSPAMVVKTGVDGL